MKAFECPRWCFVDGMRGFAALAVVFHHLVYSSPFRSALRAVLPAPLWLLSTGGRFGVQVFFVMSGFVIAHSLRNNRATGPELGNFILRRQFRLDPPYWAMIGFVLVLQVAHQIVTGSVPWLTSSFGTILANGAYLHRIVGAEQLLVVSWTLCLEIQFYLFFILILALGSFLGGGRRFIPIEAAMILITGLVSIVLARGVDPYAEIAWTWFPFQWYFFAGGVLCYHSVMDRRNDAMFAAFVAFLVVAFSWGHHWKPNVIAGSSTILIFWVVGKAGKLTTWLRQEVFQYFGRISYSLYLVHFPITTTILSFGYEISRENRSMAVAWMLVAGAVSIATAHVFHRWVEVPSMWLAASIKRPQGESRAEPKVNPAAIELPRPASRFSSSPRNPVRIHTELGS